MGDVQQQRAEWPSKKRLYELYWGEGLSFPQIAETVDASGVAVRRMFKHYGIPSRNSGSRLSDVMYANGWARTPLPSPYDTEWMHRRVRDNEMSLAAVARELDTRPETVARQLRTVDLHPNTESFGDEPWQNREWLWRQFRCEQRTIVEVAESQGISGTTVRYWMKKHDIPQPTKTARESAEADGVEPWQNRGWLWRQFRCEQRTIAEVAESQGISGTTVRYWMKKHDIPQPTKTARESAEADGGEELPDAAKALDPTINSKDTPDELINDTFAFGTNNAMGGRQGQR